MSGEGAYVWIGTGFFWGVKPDGVRLPRQDGFGVKQYVGRLWYKLHDAGLRTQRHSHDTDLGGDVFAWPQDQQVVLHRVVVAQSKLDLGAWIDLEGLLIESEPPDQGSNLDDMISFAKALRGLPSDLKWRSENYGDEEGDGNREV